VVDANVHCDWIGERRRNAAGFGETRLHWSAFGRSDPATRFCTWAESSIQSRAGQPAPDRGFRQHV